MKYIIVIFIFCFQMAFASGESPNLLLIEGTSAFGSKGRQTAAEFPLISQLRENARKQALAKLDNQDNYIQVSPWKENIVCEPLAKDSFNCVWGRASLSAYFIRKDEFDNDWYVRVGRGSFADIKQAYAQALSEAKIACNNGVILSPINIIKMAPNNFPFRDLIYYYEATFKCDKLLRHYTHSIERPMK